MYYPFYICTDDRASSFGSCRLCSGDAKVFQLYESMYVLYDPIFRPAQMTALAVLFPVVFVLAALDVSVIREHVLPFFKSALMTALAVLLPVVFVLALVTLKSFSYNSMYYTLF
jgi:hypothetical protein